MAAIALAIAPFVIEGKNELDKSDEEFNPIPCEWARARRTGVARGHLPAAVAAAAGPAGPGARSLRATPLPPAPVPPAQGERKRAPATTTA